MFITVILTQYKKQNHQHVFSVQWNPKNLILWPSKHHWSAPARMQSYKTLYMSGIIRVYQGLQIGQNCSDDSTEVTMVKNVKLSTNKVNTSYTKLAETC